MDLDLQRRAEALLGDHDGSVVAIDPNNGDVLVMASAPSFDQNDFIGGISSKKWKALMDDPGRPMNNKAIQAEYPPASTYKIITAMAGLEEQVIDRNSTFYCPGFYNSGTVGTIVGPSTATGRSTWWIPWPSPVMSFFTRPERNWVWMLWPSMQQVPVWGGPPGIRLAHERDGLIPTAAWKKKRFKEPWQAGETLSISIGQGFNLVTPLQMAVFIAAVGNGGTLYKPRIVSEITDARGNAIQTIEPEITGGLPVSKENLELVREGLLKVVSGNRGTARRIRIQDLAIAGKTGTAQVFSRKAGEKFENEKLIRTLQDHAWFVCYAPAENPKIALSVILEHGEHGSSAAAPVARALIAAYLGIDLEGGKTPATAKPAARKTEDGD